MTLIPGKEIALGGQTYVVAPLNAAATKQYRKEVNAVKLGTLPDIDLVTKLAYASLKRTYPDITMEKVEDIVDYGNYFALWSALLNVSGLVIEVGNMVRGVQESMTSAGLMTPSPTS